MAGPAPNTLARHTLPLNTDVAEWCPQPAAARLLAVGTYQLDEASQTRQGGLHFFALHSEGAAGGAAAAAPGAAPTHGQRLAQVACFDLPGVFDLRWHPRSAMPTLAAALADGSVRVLALSDSSSGSGGSEQGPDGGCDAWEGVAAAVAAAAAAGPAAAALLPSRDDAEGMAVSLDYTRCQGCEGDHLAVSYSSGQLQLFQVGRNCAGAGSAPAAGRLGHSGWRCGRPSQPLDGPRGVPAPRATAAVRPTFKPAAVCRPDRLLPALCPLPAHCLPSACAHTFPQVRHTL